MNKLQCDNLNDNFNESINEIDEIVEEEEEEELLLEPRFKYKRILNNFSKVFNYYLFLIINLFSFFLRLLKQIKRLVLKCMKNLLLLDFVRAEFPFLIIKEI